MTYSNNSLTLQDLKKVIQEVEEKDIVLIEGRPFRLSRMMMCLPVNDKGELVGIDMEVLYFHAKRTGFTVLRSKYFNANSPFIIEKPVMDFDFRSDKI